MKRIKTACPRNCYSSCSFTVIVDNNRIIGIENEKSNRATASGVCLKGLSYFERACSSNRITCPLIKDKQKNTFSEIGWEEALDIIASRLTKYKKQYGPQSVLYYAASGMAGLMNDIPMEFWKLFGGSSLTYGNLCWPAGLEASRISMGEVKHNAPWDLENARLIILWGKNPAETNIQEMDFIMAAKEKGAIVIIIDPRRTPSSTAADWLLQIRPATDAALALALAHEIIRLGACDMAFIDEHILGFEKFAASVYEKNPAWAEKITGIPANDIRELAAIMANTKPMTIIPGYGMQRYTNGGQSIRCLLALQAITGNIGKKGACWHYANLQSYVFDNLKEPLSYYPQNKTSEIFRKNISMAKLGEDILAADNPPLKMIWVERGNPLTQNPNTGKILQAFRNLEFKVVVEQFMTDTASEANIILPAKNMFEQSDIIGSYWHTYVQLKPKILDPPENVKPESEIYFLLAKKMGFKKQDIENHLIGCGDEAVKKYLNKRLAKIPGLTMEQLEEGPQLAPGTENIAFENLHFNTPSGKIELYSSQAAELWNVDPLPSYEEAIECERPGGGLYPLQLLSPNSKNHIHSQFHNLNMIKAVSEEETLCMHPDDAKERNILDGDLVDVYNNRGSLSIKVKLDYGIKKHCLSMPNGYWQEHNINWLSEARHTDMGYGSAFHNNRVEVKKA